MNDDDTDTIWVNYGMEGWSPDFSSDDLAEIIKRIQQGFYSEFVVMKRMDLQVIEPAHSASVEVSPTVVLDDGSHV